MSLLSLSSLSSNLTSRPSSRRSSLCAQAHRSRLALALLTCSLWTGHALSQPVQVENAWARATVAGQKATGAFMRLTSPSATRLVAVSTPAAGFAEVHSMRMENNVMKMSPLPDGLELPAGQPVDLKPGSFHVMLMDLPRPLLVGTTIPLTLVFRDAKGLEQRSEIKVPVNAVAPMAPMEHKH